MPSFGARSCAQLDTCDFRLVRVCNEVIPHHDFAVLCGFRPAEDQEEAFRTGRSKLQFPESKHNHRDIHPDGEEVPRSLAVDAAPWHRDSPHIRWENEREFVLLAGMMIQAAEYLGYKLRWGGNWDMDDDLYDPNRPFDLVHFELLGVE